MNSSTLTTTKPTLVTYASDPRFFNFANEAAMRKQLDMRLSPLGFHVDSFLPNPIHIELRTKKNSNSWICINDANFPHWTAADLDAKMGKHMLYTYAPVWDRSMSFSQAIETCPLNPILVRSFLQDNLRPNSSTALWSEILTHPELRSIYTPKQAGAALSKRLKGLFTRQADPDWQNDPGVKFYLLQSVEAEAIIKALFQPKKKDYDTGEVLPPDMKTIEKGINVIQGIKSQLGWQDDMIQNAILKTLSQNINWWQEKGLSLHESLGRINTAQEALL